MGGVVTATGTHIPLSADPIGFPLKGVETRIVAGGVVESELLVEDKTIVRSAPPSVVVPNLAPHNEIQEEEDPEPARARAELVSETPRADLASELRL